MLIRMSNARFSFENWSKIENSFVSHETKFCRVEKKRNLTSIHISKKSENVLNLEVKQKKMHFSHILSNKTARTG